jgi:N-methylhydantoinase A
VIVPPNPGITSALGCLLVDVRHDLSTMYLRRADQADVGEVESAFGELEREARERLAAEGVAPEDMELQRLISMRYLGQWRSLTVEVDGRLDELDGALARFHAEHEREYTYRRDDAPVELYQLQVQALGLTPKPDLPRFEPRDHVPEPAGRRPVVFDEADDALDAALYRRDALEAGARIAGPAVIEQLDSTVVVPPGWGARVDEWLMIRMEESR